MDEEALTTRQTRTETRTSPEGTPILHQGGTLSPLVGNETRNLRPVPRRKPNNNKGLSMPTRMKTSQTPANVPVSCACEAGSDPRGHLRVTWGVYLCAGKPPLADIILSHPPDLT